MELSLWNVHTCKCVHAKIYVVHLSHLIAGGEVFCVSPTKLATFPFACVQDRLEDTKCFHSYKCVCGILITTMSDSDRCHIYLLAWGIV